MAAMNIAQALTDLEAARQRSQVLTDDFNDKMAASEQARIDSENPPLGSDVSALTAAFLTAMKAAQSAGNALQVQNKTVATLETQLNVIRAEQLSALDPATTKVSTVLNASDINALGLSSTKVRSVGDGATHLIMYPKDKRRDTIKSSKALDDDLDIPLSDQLTLTRGGDGGLTAQDLLSNLGIVREFDKLLTRYDLGIYGFVYLGTTTSSDPKLQLANGSRVSAFSANNELVSVDSCAASASLLYEHTTHGSDDNDILFRLGRKVADEQLYKSVLAQYRDLPKEKQLGQVFLLMIVKAATTIDETTLDMLGEWVAKPDLVKDYGGDVNVFCDLYLKVLQVLKMYGRMPHQAARYLLQLFATNSCTEFAEVYELPLKTYKMDHAHEERVLGRQQEEVAAKHYAECAEIAKKGKSLFQQLLRSGTYTVTEVVLPRANQFNDKWTPEHRWYSREEWDKLTTAQKNRVRKLIAEKGPAKDTPAHLLDIFNKKKSKAGGYSRKEGWGGTDADEQCLKSNGGVHIFDGQLKMWCKGCGVNATHTTNGHKSWAKNPGQYVLPKSHPARTKKKFLAVSPPSPTASTADVADIGKVLKEIASMKSELKEIASMKKGLQGVASMTADLLEAEAKDDPSPEGKAARLACAKEWKSTSWLN